MVVIGVCAYLQLYNYEQGVLDVYATQQDGYVQLVLEQIRLASKRGANPEEIENIVGTLDASTNRYWTLSRQNSLVFVKNVMETNRYQGFTTASYYHTSSAQSFVQTLERDRVTHSTITIDEQPYIASGVMFVYHGVHYRVCLLTNANTVLDHNAYLTAKINLTTLGVVALCAFVVFIELLSYLADKYRRLYVREATANDVLRQQTEKLNATLQKEDLYDARRTAYTVRALPMLWQKLEGLDPYPMTFLILRCPGEELQQNFLQFTRFQMSNKILRVFLDADHILLLLLRAEELERAAIRDNVALPGVTFLGELTLAEHPEESLDACFQSFWERTKEHEEQASV